MNLDPDKTPLIAFVIGIAFGTLIGMGLMHYFTVMPLMQEAMKRGYASYVLTDSKTPNSVQFVWK